ncbi:MAG: tetratricopeptide repeat protein [Odoribacter sp.]
MKRTLRTVAVFTLAGFVISSCASLNKMKKMEKDIAYKVTPEVLEAKGGQVDLKIDATIPAKYFNKKVTLVATPVLKFQNGGEKAYEPKTFQGEKVQGNNEVVPYAESKTVSYNGSVPFEEGMRISGLYVKFVGSKGAKSVDYESRKIADGVLATATMVNNAPAIAIGADQFERITKEEQEAAIYYLINSAQIRTKEIKSEEIKAMEKFIKDAKAAEDMELKNIQIQSYASPDGPMSLNEKLADNREGAADKFVKNSMKKNKIDEYKNLDFFKKYVVAEDWEGFKKAMEASNIRDKELILRVLAMHSDPEVREREIKNISSAFSTIADQILPKLRRSKFIVNAERIGKSDEQIRDLAKSNPSALNVEELLYAATLFDNNGDKLAIYETAMKQFPNDWRGFNDAGMILFEMGKVDQAKADFQKADQMSANNKVVKNNLGAVALKNGNVKEAEVLFGAATGAGDEVNYNKGIVAIMNGDYKAAVDYFGKCNCENAALANLLAGNNNEAAKKLNDNKSESALSSYLKAVVAARNNDTNAVLSNLKAACAKDAAMKQLAATDLEFAKLFENADFKAIVK